jgi:hypothetical protein
LACRTAVSARIDLASKELLRGRGAAAVVAFLSETEGISRRQAQRIVGRAYGLIVDDVEKAGVDRRELTAQLIATLQEASASALEKGHVTGAVAACRELRELLGLGPQPARPMARTYWAG